MANEVLPRDANYVPMIGAVTNDANLERRFLRVNPSTNRLLVEAAVSELTVTDIEDGAGDSIMDASNNAIRANIVAGGAGNGSLLDGVDSDIKASVFDYTNANPLAVRLSDLNGDYIAAGAGTQYANGDAVASPVGTVILGFDGSNVRALATDTSGNLQLALAESTNTIGKLAANPEVYIGDVVVTNTVTVDGSGATQPISAESLPLPTGAATAAKQPALGTAGTPSTDVITIQGITSMTPLKTDGSGVTQPVSASSLPLPTGAATEAKQDTIIGHIDGVETLLGTIDADTGNIATNTATLAGAVSGTEMQVDVVGALPAGSNAIGKLAANDGVDIGDVTINNESLPVTLTTLPDTADNDLAAIKTAVQVIDDWDESDRAKVNPIVGQAGVAAGAGAIGATTQRVTTAYDTGWLTTRARYTDAQTNAALVTAGAGEIIVVKQIMVRADNANTNDTGFILGFHASTTPTGAGAIDSHPGIAPGSGVTTFFGESGIIAQATGDDLRITSEDPGGGLDVLVVYKIVT